MSFNKIIGHEEQISYLKKIIRDNTNASSYLFTGPEAIGKKITAVNFAKALNCLNFKDDICDECASCKKIDSFNFPDLHIIKPSGKGSAIKIDTVREIRREAYLKPYEGKFKVFIIDDADNLTQESQNALLKILEEPPSRTVFILITRLHHRITGTIRSRCHILRFKAISAEEISDFLVKTYFLKREKALFLSKFSGGKIGEAIKMKDSDMIERKNAIINKIKNMNMERNCSDKSILKENLEIMLSWYRDIFVSKTGYDEKFLFNIDRKDDILREANKFKEENLENIINKLITLNSYIDANVNPKIVMDALLSEVEDLERINNVRSSSGKA